MQFYKNISLVEISDGKWQLVVKVNEVKEERINLTDSQLNYILSMFRQGV